MAQQTRRTENLSVATSFQERFNVYFLAIIFGVLAVAIHTTTFEGALVARAMELFAWVLLVVSGIAGLLRQERLPECYRLRASKAEKEDLRNEVQKALLRGATEFHVVPGEQDVPPWQYRAELEAAIDQVERRLKTINVQLSRRYRVQRWSFFLALVFLLASRGHRPAIEIGRALRHALAGEEPRPAR